GGVTNAPTIKRIKYAYFLTLRKNWGVSIPKLVKNIVIIGISNKSANEMVILSKNLKNFPPEKFPLTILSFKDNEKGKISLINIKYPKTNPNIKSKKTAGIYIKETLLSCFVKPGLINNHN